MGIARTVKPTSPSSSPTLPPVYAWITIQSTMAFRSRRISGLTEDPCGSRLLMRRPSPSGNSGSPRVPHLRRSRPFPPQTALTPRRFLTSITPTTAWSRFGSFMPRADSPSLFREVSWYGMFGTPNACYNAQILRSVQRCPSPPMVVSSHAQLADQTFISGRSLPLAISFTEYLYHVFRVLVRSSPETENRLPCLVIA